jgi:hypothetical protein
VVVVVVNLLGSIIGLCVPGGGQFQFLLLDHVKVPFESEINLPV